MEDEGYEYSKWDTILAVVFIVVLVIGIVVIGILATVLLMSDQAEGSLQLEQGTITATSVIIN